MRYHSLITAAAIALLAGPASADEVCNTALRNQAKSSGIPASLAEALSTSLALGPLGKMYANAVSVDGKVSIETSPSSAVRLALTEASRGARDVRIGCLGATVTANQSDSDVRQALDPVWNVRQALGGISSGGSNDIGAPLAAILDGSAAPTSQAEPAQETQPPEPPRDLSVGQPKTKLTEGAVGATWGLFNDRRPGPLSNP